jgi:sugar phosphate isomerase/epimerase
MQFSAFRSLWGWEAKLASPSTLSNLIKSIQASRTFQGVELSLGDACLPFGGSGSVTSVTVPRLRKFAEAINNSGVSVILGVYSSWQDYGSGGWEHLPVSKHVDTFKWQVDAIFEAGLRPVLVNSHRFEACFSVVCIGVCDMKPAIGGFISGSDSWSADACREYFQGVLEHCKSVPCTVAHETHRGRCLFSPWQTQRLLQDFPDLKLTADVSHWTLVSERLLRSPEEMELIRTIAPAVRHIHGRVGGPQVS